MEARAGTHSQLNELEQLKCCFTSTDTVCLLGTGAQDVHLDFDTPSELWAVEARELIQINSWVNWGMEAKETG